MTDMQQIFAEAAGGKPYYVSDFNVRWEEMDVNAHVNYAVYLDYFSEGRLEAIGHDLVSELRRKHIGPVIYKIEVEYLLEMHHPDTAHVVTWVSEVESKTRIAVRQNIYSKTTGKLVTRGTFHSIFMDTAKRKPTRIPEVIVEKFGLNV